MWGNYGKTKKEQEHRRAMECLDGELRGRLDKEKDRQRSKRKMRGSQKGTGRGRKRITGNIRIGRRT